VIFDDIWSNALLISDPNSYLIFVISFTQAGFLKTKFYTHTTKDTKNTKHVSEKVKCMQFFSLNLETRQILLTQAPLVVLVTNMRVLCFVDI